MTSAQVRRELVKSGDVKLARELEKKTSAITSKLPEPTAATILESYNALTSYFSLYRDKAAGERIRRYQQDKTPKKYQRDMEDGRRFFSRLTHTEINQVVGQQTDNPPRWIVPVGGDHKEDRDKALKQTRWLNNLLDALERSAKGRRGSNLRRRAVDIQNEIGMVALEVYLTNSYDDIDGTPKADETPAETMARIDALTKGRKMPFGVRVIDGLALLFDEDDDDTGCVLIPEMKPWHSQRRKYGDKLGDKPEGTPNPGAMGYPQEQPNTSMRGPTGIDLVETIRYYDEEWYAYLVNGVIVDGPRRHRMPGIPVFPFFGLVTGSPNMEEGVEGICWGMGSAEVGLNDIVTLMMDTMWKHREAKWVIETDLEGRTIPDPTDVTKSLVLDLSDSSAVQQLNPGQRLKNAYEGWEPWFQMPLLDVLLSMWGRSAQNPIAKGESPGADPAGYTVALLGENATTVYKDNVANEARAWGQVGDFIRLMIRDTIKVPIPLTVPMEDKRKNGVEWLDLGPDDITEVPCIVTIDPNSDAHRLAMRESWMKGNQARYVPRREVQVRAFGAEDPEAWDDEIFLDDLRERVAQIGMEAAVQDVAMTAMPVDQPPPPPTILGPNGQPLAPSGGGGPAAGPAAPNPPTVGAGQAAASSVGTPPNMAGQDNGYVPRSAR